ncbi:dihydroxyacetone kinase phosphoryl donor subunit DhaM [Umezawaea beigongshangensis]|uniref:dihydroxyacetone kinase phosphoryl donor subunit DhaM n=1 Tax=Umezawaea beigongshangensis TaxID=2780383 RepID=UPI0027DCA149|nr:dihydroxyacetone kinase phosphoryl donor subunit DhaM [Umezawaea beigongshangensis]
MTASARVGLVVVSHSRQLAAGVVEVAAQMAPQVAVLPVGGTADGGIGTDPDAVSRALSAADSGAGAAVLYDLGSAGMAAELAAETAADPDAVLVVDAPLVEGAVAAAVAAQSGAGLATVAEAARSAAAAGPTAVPAEPPREQPAVAGGPTSAEVLLTNEVGLHARPAALLARTVAELDARVVVRYGGHQADAASVLALMGLGAGRGARVAVTASGPQAEEAIRRVRGLAERNFEE